MCRQTQICLFSLVTWTDISELTSLERFPIFSLSDRVVFGCKRILVNFNGCYFNCYKWSSNQNADTLLIADENCQSKMNVSFCLPFSFKVLFLQGHLGRNGMYEGGVVKKKTKFLSLVQTVTSQTIRLVELITLAGFSWQVLSKFSLVSLCGIKTVLLLALWCSVAKQAVIALQDQSFRKKANTNLSSNPMTISYERPMFHCT